MERRIDYRIENQDGNLTVRDFLLQHGFSAKNILFLKKSTESIVLNDKAVYVNAHIQAGDLLSIFIKETESSHIEPISYPIDIVYEDEDLLIVNKPWGMPTIPSLNHHKDSLANGVCAYYQAQNQEFIYRPVNRLDKDTSGLVLIAKHTISASMLSAAIVRGEIQKSYTAIATGVLPPSGTIDAPIARCDASLITRCVDFTHGDDAITHYRTITQKENCALVSICPETGRTHQIRVHFSHIGHPLIGDTLYGGSDAFMKRHALHADFIQFIQPLTGKKIICRLPLPEDMLDYWNQLS